MADTRTIFLLSDKNIYCSDPKLNNEATYLDLSDFDSLNPTLDLSVAGNAMVSSYQPYEVSMTATFNTRSERATWIQTNAGRIKQIAVANTSDQGRVWNKKAALTGVEFIENTYVNGVQTVLKFKLFGKWQSTLTEIPIASGVYSGGTKQYADTGYPDYTNYTDKNLINNTKTLRGNNIFSSNISDAGTTDDGFRYTKSSVAWASIRIALNTVPDWTVGEKYTYSLDIKNTGTNTVGIRIYGDINEHTKKLTDVPPDNEWHRYSHAVTAKGNIEPLRFEPETASTNGEIFMKAPKLEFGEVSKPEWRPSQLDLDSGLYVPYAYQYNNELRYGSTVYTSALDLGNETGFVVVATRGAGLSINIKGGDTLLTLESSYSDLITGFSSEYVAYPYTAFDNLTKFTILEGGTLLTYGLNIEPQEMPILYDLLNNADTTPLTIGALNQLGKPVPVKVYGYTQQDFI